MWNSLPDNAILADNGNQFKNCLDKHWKMHDIVFNYRVTLLKPEVWHELIRIVKIKWFKWLNVFHKDVDIEAVACVHNLQYSEKKANTEPIFGMLNYVRYLFVGIRYFLVFQIVTSVSVLVFQNIIYRFGISVYRPKTTANRRFSAYMYDVAKSASEDYNFEFLV